MKDKISIEQKYRLALLQLKEYSDNDLIIQEGQKISISKELKKLKNHEYRK
jgi:hypothetical protein